MEPHRLHLVLGHDRTGLDRSADRRPPLRTGRFQGTLAPTLSVGENTSDCFRAHDLTAGTRRGWYIRTAPVVAVWHVAILRRRFRVMGSVGWTQAVGTIRRASQT